MPRGLPPGAMRAPHHMGAGCRLAPGVALSRSVSGTQAAGAEKRLELSLAEWAQGAGGGGREASPPGRGAALRQGFGPDLQRP